MSNPWVEHVRKYAKDNNITYMCAITEASKTYKKPQSKLQSKPPPKPPPKPQPKVKKTKKEEEDIINDELQQLMVVSGNEKIKKALAKINYKGRSTAQQMKDLIKELKKNI